MTWESLDTFKAKTPTTPKAKNLTIDGSGPYKTSNSHTVPKDAFEFGFTGFKTDPMAADSLHQLQRDMNLLYNQVLDNVREYYYRLT